MGDMLAKYDGNVKETNKIKTKNIVILLYLCSFMILDANGTREISADNAAGSSLEYWKMACIMRNFVICILILTQGVFPG